MDKQPKDMPEKDALPNFPDQDECGLRTQAEQDADMNAGGQGQTPPAGQEKTAQDPVLPGQESIAEQSDEMAVMESAEHADKAGEEKAAAPALTLEAPALCGMKRRWLLLLSFLFPFIICCIVYIAGGFYPFGNKQILVTDFWHQYYAMICEFREKLLEGGSLFYTWHSGLGSNFLSMMGYYCASPLNLLTVLIPEAGLRLGVSVILMAKIGLCGLTSSICLMGVTKKKDLSVVFFSGLFALCAFIMGYYWNIMWLDSVALFPLVMLGVLYLIRDKKPLLYTLSLFFSLLCNYYIGFYICIAVALTSIATAIICWDGLWGAIKSFFRMLFHSAIAIGLSAPLLLPSYLALQNTYSVSNGGIGSRLFNGSVPQFLSALLPYQYPNSKDLSTPNLCCGLICLFLFFIFLTGRYKLREKISACTILVFLFVSFIIRPLDWLWNGGHYTNMIPFRYSFIFSFILVLIAYRVFVDFDKVKMKQILFAVEICLIGIILLYMYTGLTVTLLCLLTLAVYTVIVLLYMKGRLNGRLFSGVICLCICVEAACAGAFGISSYSVYDTYLHQADEVKALVDSQQEQALVRTELSSYKTLNDPLLYSYNGVSQFSSSAHYGVSSLLTKLGAGGYCSGNRYAYSQSTPASMSLFAIKYIISKAATNAGDTTLTEAGRSGESTMYEYRYHLPIGFMVQGGLEPALTSSNPFHNQAALLSQMTGLPADLYEECPEPEVQINQGTVYGSYGSYTYESPDGSANLTFTYTCEKDGNYYIIPRIEDAGSVTVMYDAGKAVNFSYKSSQACILPAGYHKAGETFTVITGVSASATPKSARMNAYVMNEERFSQYYDFLKQNCLEDVRYTDTRITGTIANDYDGYLYTSIPYEKGWQIWVDGQQQESGCYAGAFLSVYLPEGEHTLEFRYIPEGFKTGCILFGGCLLLLTLSLWIRKRKKAFY